MAPKARLRPGDALVGLPRSSRNWGTMEQRERYRFLGIPVDALTLSEVIELTREAIIDRRRVQHVVVNVAKVVTAQNDPLLRDDIENSDLISVDGMGVVWGCRLLGIPIPERVTGIDLMFALLALSAEEGFRPFILGAKEEILQAAVENLRRDHPDLQLAGYRNGYFSEAEEPDVVEQIRQSHADLLFIGMPTPRKERFLHCHRDEIQVPFMMGVGGSVDVLAGIVRRAPAMVQKLGLEWAYRVLQEPRRLWRRYFYTNLGYARLMLRALMEKWLLRADLA
jgi:N-acetylglucosaminyldiphosphoundecaprenol N-acetyl-beta-D-mannosaminyltransferase